MSVNREKMLEAFLSKNYRLCISSLRDEIKKILIQRLKEKNPDFSYTTISQLKEAVFVSLGEVEKRAVLTLSLHSNEEISEKVELDDLLDVYESLQ